MQEVVRRLSESGVRRLPAGPLPAPEAVKQLVTTRVTWIGEAPAALLRAAAVIGSEFDVDLAAELQDLAPETAADALDTAVSARLIVDVPGESGRCAFVHALVQEALRATIGRSLRQRLHARVTAALEPLAEADPDRYLPALAHHALEGAPVPDRNRAVELAERAAEGASAVHAYEDAAVLLHRALGVLRPPAGARRRCQLLCALGDALSRAGDSQRARSRFDETAELARVIGDGELLSRAALGAGGVGVTILAVDRLLVERLEESLAALEDGDPTRVRVLARLAIELAYDPDEARRDHASRQAVKRARHVTHWGPGHAEARLVGVGH